MDCGHRKAFAPPSHTRTHTHTQFSPVALYNCLIAFKCSSKKCPWAPGPKSDPKYLPEAAFGERFGGGVKTGFGGQDSPPPRPPGPLKSALGRQGPKRCPKQFPDVTFSESFGGGRKTVFEGGKGYPPDTHPYTHTPKTHTLIHTRQFTIRREICSKNRFVN